MPALFRRREVMWPTLWGWLLLLAVVGGTATWLARQLGPWLAVTAPVGVGAADLLVVEGWLGERELDAAAAYARAMSYRRVVTSGGPIPSFSPFATYAERAAQHLRTRLPDMPVDAVPMPATAQDRTYASAVRVRDWARQRSLPVATIEVYSVGAHARRSRLIYRLAFGEATRVGIVAGVPQDTDIERWWTSSEGAKSVLSEALSLGWTLCCFRPGAGPGSAAEDRH